MIPILQATQISKTFSSPSSLTVFEDISLSIFPKESIAIMGKSGSGKSALLHILSTLDSPSSGTLIFPHYPFLSFQEIRAIKVGFIFQAFHLLEDHTVWENVLMPGKIAKQHPSFLTHRGQELLTLVDLYKKKEIPAKLLSGGEKQRLAIARALFNDPDILFADEPTGSLDEENAFIVRSLLFKAVVDHNKSLLLVTHDQDLASLCCKKFTLKDKKLFLDEK